MRTIATRVIHATAPIRICDNGGWSDTWFARTGSVFSIAVSPVAEVQLRVNPLSGNQALITIHAENYGDRYTIAEPRGFYSKHPLLEAAVEFMGVPPDCDIEATIYSEAPAGCSTGTSASVSVALLAALDRLRGAKEPDPYRLAMAAHHVETVLLKQQCGIQDQLAAAYGGINHIDILEYPRSLVRPLHAPPELLWELEARLVLIYLGVSHNSSDVHRMVIRQLEAEGGASPRLNPIRRCAAEAAAAFEAGNLEALGRSFIANTEAQANLHPELVGPRHRQVIDIARSFGASGWKVNGAGGEGGSVAILSPAHRAARREMVQVILSRDPLFRAIPVRLHSRGTVVWETTAS
jgi:D-glycero-alpha-D-manno-heptose-7-phosphate kinase